MSSQTDGKAKRMNRNRWAMAARRISVRSPIAAAVAAASLVAVAMALTVAPSSATPPPAVTLPSGNAAQQWDKIAEDTVVGAGAFQGEGFVYLAYVSKAMDGAVNPGQRTGRTQMPPSRRPPTTFVRHFRRRRRASPHCTMQR